MRKLFFSTEEETDTIRLIAAGVQAMRFAHRRVSMNFCHRESIGVVP
jgi:hypothetical protein